MTTPPAPLEAAERRRVIWVIVATLIAITLPYLWVAATTPPGYVFRGLLFSPDDQDVHLAWAQQATHGHFFFRDLFTTESLSSGERPLFSNLFCWAMGLIAAIAGLPLVYVYHALRLIFSALTLWFFYGLCRRTTEDKRVRLVALLLAAFSLGCGWLMDFGGYFASLHFVDRPDGQYPMMPEAFTFSSAFVFPLFVASMALLLGAYNNVFEIWDSGSKKAIALASLCALLLANIHTYDALPFLATLFLWLVGQAFFSDKARDTKRFARFLPVFLCGLLPIFLQWLVFRGSHEFQVKALTPTPAESLSSMLWSYGLLIPLAGAGACACWRTGPGRLLALWMFVTFAMIYAPVSFARKMIEGLHLPLCLLTAAGLLSLLARATPDMRRIAIGGAIALLGVSSLRFVLWCSTTNPHDNNLSRGLFMPPVYLSQGDWNAEQYLVSLPQNEKLSSAVLCLPKLGNCIPADAGMYVYVGHWAETLYQGNKLREAYAFYSGRMSEQTALQWLKANHIGYVVIGEYEPYIKGFAPPIGQLHLQPVEQSAGTTLYKVP